jgi:hypothetical protein
MDIGILPRGKSSPATKSKSPICTQIVHRHQAITGNQIMPSLQEERVRRYFTRDPNLLSSISRSSAEDLLVSDTTFQALDGDSTRKNSNSQEFKVI